MYSPGCAIVWQIYWRCRWAFIAAAVFLLAAIVLSHALPSHWTIRVDKYDVPAVGWLLGILCVFVNVLLVAAFSMNGGDAREYTYARHMLVLPVRTRTLVFWPMFSGCVTVAGFWLVVASLVFRATGTNVPLWWPAAMFALFLAMFQLVAWTPFAQRWLHGAWTVAVFISPLVVLLLGILADIQLSERVVTLILIGLLPVAYVAAHSGVERARRSAYYDWRTWDKFVAWLAHRRAAASHPFRSMQHAQLWYECRAHMIIPVFVACMLPCFFFVPLLEPRNVAHGWKLLGILLVAPVLVGTLAGASLGNLVDPLSKFDSRTFLLVRPISSATIVRSKLSTAAIMTAMIWIIFAGYISLLLLRPGFIQSIGHVAGRVPWWKAVGYPLLILSLLVLFTWKNMVETVWIGLTGRKWLESALGVGTGGLILGGIGAGLWIGFHPELLATAEAAIPWFVGLLLVIKLTSGIAVVCGLVHLRLATPRGTALMVLTWAAAVLLLGALAVVLLPDELAPAGKIIPGITLLMPFASLAGAPLALYWNRHR